MDSQTLSLYREIDRSDNAPRFSQFRGHERDEWKRKIIDVVRGLFPNIKHEGDLRGQSFKLKRTLKKHELVEVEKAIHTLMMASRGALSSSDDHPGSLLDASGIHAGGRINHGTKKLIFEILRDIGAIDKIPEIPAALQQASNGFEYGYCGIGLDGRTHTFVEAPQGDAGKLYRKKILKAIHLN